MSEFFYVTNSNAAPFFSDKGSGFVEARSADEALGLVRGRYKHPAGLYAAQVYESSDAYHKGTEPLASWLSRRADVRENGVACPVCGTRTEAVSLNDGDGGTDTHYCENHHRISVDNQSGDVARILEPLW
jgi:hypothetical protein